MKKVVSRLRAKVARLKRGKKKGNAVKQEDVLCALTKYFSGPGLEFFTTQIKLASCKSRKGHRYTNEMKALCLTLYHQSPKCYRLLKKMFRLPSVQTLRNCMQKVNIRPGFHHSILEGLKAKVENMSEKQKLCAIVYDEMAIKENLVYDVERDSVEGLEDSGTGGRTGYVANHAGVFLVRGLIEKWKQPVGYVLSSGPVNAKDLKQLCLQCIDRVQSVGLIPKVILCDQGSNNRSMLTSLGVSRTRPYFEHSGHKIFAMFDPPHLIKNVQNNFKKTGFTLDGKAFKWEHVEQFYSFDSSLPIRMAPKVSEKHINLPPFTAMRVKLATQVLSHSVAAGISTMCALGKLEEEAQHTAEFIEDMDCLFNVFNSQSLSDAHELQRAIKPNSRHIDFLSKCSEWLSRLKPTGKDKILPCVLGWQMSIACLTQLWEELQTEYGVDFLITNRLNQDCLENFFSIMRGKGGHRDNPDAMQFRSAYRAAAVDSMFIISKGSNCREDMDCFLLKLSTVSQVSPTAPAEGTSLPSNMLDLLAISNAPNMSLAEENIVVYLAGYLVRKVTKKFSCPDCKDQLVSHSAPSTSAQWTFLSKKQYSHLAEGGLYRPSEDLVAMVTEMEAIFRTSVPGIIHGDKIRGKLFSRMTGSSNLPQISCIRPECIQMTHYIIHLYITVRLHHVLREQNRKFQAPNQKRNRKAMKLLHI